MLTPHFQISTLILETTATTSISMCTLSPLSQSQAPMHCSLVF